MSKARASTQEPSKSTGGEDAAEEKKKRERKRGRWCKKVDPMAEFEKHSSDEDDEEEDNAPVPKAQKLMGDAIKSGVAPSKPKSAPKAQAQKPPKPKRNTRSIPAEEKNKAPMPQAEEEDDELVA
nr:histone H1-I-like [Aegilops tauschii subsp. strangulata]